MAKGIIIDGFEISFTRRRYGGRYGGTTYTWAHVKLGPDHWDWQQFPGDPWPCINPPVAELREQLRRFVSPIDQPAWAA